MWKVTFLQNRVSSDSFAIGISREITTKPDCPFLSCSALAVVTLQLPTCFTRVAFWQVNSRESLARSSRKNPLECAHTWILHTLSHTTLAWFPPKYRISNCGNIRNLARNKVNTWLYKFNVTKTPKQTLDLKRENGNKGKSHSYINLKPVKHLNHIHLYPKTLAHNK